ncbi:MAG: hypothetical protein C0501_26555 [Isosphaera sp.]|nr:hypothetical protein [Isosphaera sp.]
MDGPFQLGTGYRFAEFTDGLSHTVLVGEKHVRIDALGVGWDDCSTYNGDYFTCSARALSRSPSHRLTTDPRAPGWRFGSRHTGVVQFCFADGRVRPIPEFTDPYVLELLGGRHDGQVVPDF